MNAPKDVYWTGPVKTAICEASIAGFPGPLRIHAQGVAQAQQGEWQLADGRRYDVTCLTDNGGLLVAESEFSGPREVLEDFCKLLLAREEVGAELRVMVFNRKRDMSFQDLEKVIRQHHDKQPGDTYLLAAFTNGQIEYYRVNVDQALNVQGRRLE